MKSEHAHKFLSRIGKTKIRPGGSKGTDFLLKKVNITKDSKILEVACNTGGMILELVKKYDPHITGIDNDPEVIQVAKKNLPEEKYPKVKIECLDARKLPYPDNHFDFILNQAMLVVITDKVQKEVLAEYHRVLKPNGYLLTQDAYLKEKGDESVVAVMRKVLHSPTSPKKLDVWLNMFKEHNFKIADYKLGEVCFLNCSSLLKDEGFFKGLNIYRKGLKKENKKRFKSIKNLFKQNKDKVGYISVVSQKT